MKENAKNPNDILEKYLFFRVDSSYDMNDIASNGFKCENTEDEEKNLLSPESFLF